MRATNHTALRLWRIFSVNRRKGYFSIISQKLQRTSSRLHITSLIMKSMKSTHTDSFVGKYLTIMLYNLTICLINILSIFLLSFRSTPFFWKVGPRLQLWVSVVRAELNTNCPYFHPNSYESQEICFVRYVSLKITDLFLSFHNFILVFHMSLNDIPARERSFERSVNF